MHGHSKTALEILKCWLTVCIQSIRSLKRSYRTFGYNLVRDNATLSNADTDKTDGLSRDRAGMLTHAH